MTLIDTGYRLAPPPGCPRNLYNVMIMCWYLPEKIIIKVEHCLLRNERHNSAEPSAGFSYILGLCWGHGGALHMEDINLLIQDWM